MKKFYLITPIVFLLAGCGSLSPTRVPQTVDRVPDKLKIKTEAVAKIVVIQKLAVGARCNEVKGDLKVTVKNDNDGKKYPVNLSCTLIPSSVVAVTKTFAPKGDYKIEVDDNPNWRKTIGKPIVSADPQDPDANSGAEQDFGGALALAENQTLKGKVNFANGFATNWIELKSKGGSIGLFLLAEPSTDVRARVFSIAKGSSNPKLITSLLPKVKKTLRPSDGTLYVQIVGQRYQGEVNYTLTRRDSAITKSINVPVIDLYPVNSNSSVVLLKPSENLKINDELQISARRGKGDSVSIGKCVVTSVSDSQVSCRMQAVPSADLSNYRAQLIKDGSNT